MVPIFSTPADHNRSNDNSSKFKENRKLEGVWKCTANGNPDELVRRDKDFDQTLHVGGNHWVTVTNIGWKENKMKVFDSLCQKLSKKEKQKLCLSLAVLLNMN